MRLPQPKKKENPEKETEAKSKEGVKTEEAKPVNTKEGVESQELPAGKPRPEEGVKPEESLENLKFSVEKKLVEEVYTHYKIIDDEIGKLSEDLKKLNNYTSQIKGMEDTHKQEIQTLEQKIGTEAATRIQNYKQQVEKLKSDVENAIKNYKKALTDMHTNVVQPYRALLERGEKLKKGLEAIEEEIKKYKQEIGSCSSQAEKVSKNPVISTILAKYAVRKDPGEEAILVAELLDEDPNTLRDVIRVGKELGYTNNQLMPIIAAFQLEFYQGGKPDENKCREVSILPNDVDGYICDLIIRAKDEKLRDKLMTETYKLHPTS